MRTIRMWLYVSVKGMQQLKGFHALVTTAKLRV